MRRRWKYETLTALQFQRNPEVLTMIGKEGYELVCVGPDGRLYFKIDVTDEEEEDDEEEGSAENVLPKQVLTQHGPMEIRQ